MGLSQQFTPQIESISLDEAFLDVTGSLQLIGSAEKIGRAIKNQINQKFDLTSLAS
jgi:DNA polymerase-4